jgi:hypothetical protein
MRCLPNVHGVVFQHSRSLVAYSQIYGQVKSKTWRGEFDAEFRSDPEIERVSLSFPKELGLDESKTLPHYGASSPGRNSQR